MIFQNGHLRDISVATFLCFILPNVCSWSFISPFISFISTSYSGMYKINVFKYHALISGHFKSGLIGRRRWHWPNWWTGKSVRGDLINLIYYFSPSWNLLSIKNDLVKRFYIYFMMVWKWWLGGKNPEKVKILIFWRVRSSTRFDDIF